MGCGRVGAQLAGLLDDDGHDVTILDTDSYSFRRLSPTFGGKAGIEEADVFVALTQGDNRNVMATQIAKHIFNVPRAICRIYDPLRQELYNTLGIETFSPTTIFAQLVKEKIES